jgi:hypothetical protein
VIQAAKDGLRGGGPIQDEVAISAAAGPSTIGRFVV